MNKVVVKSNPVTIDMDHVEQIIKTDQICDDLIDFCLRDNTNYLITVFNIVRETLLKYTKEYLAGVAFSPEYVDRTKTGLQSYQEEFSRRTATTKLPELNGLIRKTVSACQSTISDIVQEVNFYDPLYARISFAEYAEMVISNLEAELFPNTQQL